MKRPPGRAALAAVLLAVTAGAALVVHAQDGAVRSGDVVLRYWGGQDRLARSLLPDAGSVRFPGLPPDILDRGTDIIVFLAPDPTRFDSLTGGRAPEWGAGVALPQLGIIIIPGYVSDRTGTHQLPVILRHELAHVALQRHLGDADVPRWFTEGYATWAAGQFDDNEGWMLRLALLTGRAPPLDSLTLDWPLMVADARLAYMLSASATRYLVSLGRPDTFERFLDVWAESGSFEQALRQVYILSSPQFERLWRAHVRRHYGWLQIAAQTLFIWVLLSVLVLALFVIRRRRDRARMAQLRLNELPDQPAYWVDDPEPDQTTSQEPGSSSEPLQHGSQPSSQDDVPPDPQRPPDPPGSRA
jgi:hypothetical protein